MRISEIIWLDEIVDKLRSKHGIEPAEVETALETDPYFFFVEKGHRKAENVYGALGRSDAGKYLLMYFVYTKRTSALIVSAREMAPKDRRRYERRS